uniref:Oocyst wall protein n=1 Tax=Chromera velia CCMP2878 TaxID=1169474 RepID=A0A0G4IE44_9ALVE|eukprot:Cvel_13496.t1-p1 / transcript=Cvel_13496.t1 / gene=Cvel_13496 / organism=Chromera_velia_CCMP2878 / gene_product=hypothetical protein / transcript_product=hypothetical protein / location=Cvel_scaffold924:1046-3690(+) / protein_length=573 / sequence_SO=supercontig / SO=protein_coding / is_pseudo=false
MPSQSLPPVLPVRWDCPPGFSLRGHGTVQYCEKTEHAQMKTACPRGFVLDHKKCVALFTAPARCKDGGLPGPDGLCIVWESERADVGCDKHAGFKYYKRDNQCVKEQVVPARVHCPYGFSLNEKKERCESVTVYALKDEKKEHGVHHRKCEGKKDRKRNECVETKIVVPIYTCPPDLLQRGSECYLEIRRPPEITCSTHAWKNGFEKAVDGTPYCYKFWKVKPKYCLPKWDFVKRDGVCVQTETRHTELVCPEGFLLDKHSFAKGICTKVSVLAPTGCPEFYSLSAKGTECIYSPTTASQPPGISTQMPPAQTTTTPLPAAPPTLPQDEEGGEEEEEEGRDPAPATPSDSLSSSTESDPPVVVCPPGFSFSAEVQACTPHVPLSTRTSHDPSPRGPTNDVTVLPADGAEPTASDASGRTEVEDSPSIREESGGEMGVEREREVVAEEGGQGVGNVQEAAAYEAIDLEGEEEKGNATVALTTDKKMEIEDRDISRHSDKHRMGTSNTTDYGNPLPATSSIDDEDLPEGKTDASGEDQKVVPGAVREVPTILDEEFERFRVDPPLSNSSSPTAIT